MKKFIIILIITTAIFTAGCSTPYWVQQADKVELGMTRPEVEKYLPVFNTSPTYVFAAGDTVVYSYWVDPKWKVTVFYNFNGMPKTDTYDIDWDKSDSVQVIGLPEVKKEKMFIIKPLNF